MEDNRKWLRPVTTRRYIHPPMAERMYTIWAEGKIIFGEVIEGIDWRSYEELDCCGIWLVHGQEDEQYDFRRSGNTMKPDGTPIHGLSLNGGKIGVDIETFCNIDRKPTCFVKIILENKENTAVSEKFGIIIRSGREKQLVYGSPDVYVSYAPDVNVWKETKSIWKIDRSDDMLLIRDGENYISESSELGAVWNDDKGILYYNVNLDAGEKTEIMISIGKGEYKEFDYDTEQIKCREYWKGELARINKIPKSIDGENLKIIQNLTVQLLQCFCYVVGGEYVYARQGGMQRLIWPWESIPVLEALDRIGDFDDYIEPVFKLYFEKLQAEDGEIRPAGENWACITSSVMYSFAKYASNGHIEIYNKYRDNIFRAYEWMKNKRSESLTIDNCIKGLFPPMRGNDNSAVYQVWGTTDLVNLDGLKMLAETAEKYGDKRASVIRAEYDDYFCAMRKAFDRFAEAGKDSDEIYIPVRPDINHNDEHPKKVFVLYHGRFVKSGLLTDDEIIKVFNNIRSIGIFGNDLYGNVDKSHVWYTMNPDYCWFNVWMRMGKTDMAEDIIKAQLKYSMTSEYYMVERYRDDDPYYAPWSPNASGNGRMILMLLEYYGK